MTIWVFHDGRMVEKSTLPPPLKFAKRSNLSSPRVSRFEEMQSPVTEKTISSWRERDRDMYRADAADPRDLPRKPFERRKEKVAAMKAIEAGNDG